MCVPKCFENAPAIIICKEKGVVEETSCDVTSVECPIRHSVIIFTIPHLFDMHAPHATCALQTILQMAVEVIIKLLLAQRYTRRRVTVRPSNIEAADGDIKVALA